MALIVSRAVSDKLKDKHGVTIEEVKECLMNREGDLLEDTREQHKTEPPTQWFIASTDKGRKLKVIVVVDDGKIFLKSAFEPNLIEEYLYKKHGFSN